MVSDTRVASGLIPRPWSSFTKTKNCLDAATSMMSPTLELLFAALNLGIIQFNLFYFVSGSSDAVSSILGSVNRRGKRGRASLL